MNLRWWSSLLPLVLVAATVNAQSGARYQQWADSAIARGDATTAAHFYTLALEQEPGRMDLQWSGAEAYRATHRHADAATLYSKVLRKDNGRRYPGAQRWLAEMQMAQGRYADAEANWKRALQRDRGRTSGLAQRAEHAMEGCRLAMDSSYFDARVAISSAGPPVNTDASEFGASIGPDSALYYSALQADVDAEGMLLDTTARTMRYRAEPFGAGWQLPTALHAPPGSQEANTTWSSDGAWTYFTRCSTGTCRILAHPSAQPQQAAPLKGLEAAYATHPRTAVFQGQQRLLFTVRNKGNYDLYWGLLKGAELTAVEMIPGNVHSPGNEITPFLLPSGELIFASDHWPGHGGFDLFRSAWTDKGFALPRNMGRPVNSPANDLYWSLDTLSNSAWFTSNRRGSTEGAGALCCNDLYHYPWPEGRPKVSPPPSDPIASVQNGTPIRLYFHNDEPDPRSWDTTTTTAYARTYDAYVGRLHEYAEAWRGAAAGDAAFRDFFTNEVRAGALRLDSFAVALAQVLAEGRSVDLHVRGFASPLARSDYNRNLSLRRIRSLELYLYQHAGGALARYMAPTDEGGVRLRIIAQPFGNSTADGSVSDRLDDLRHSVYSVGAARERRIEIEQVVLH